MRLDEGEIPSCVTEAEVSSSLPFMRTGRFWLCICEMRVGLGLTKRLCRCQNQ